MFAVLRSTPRPVLLLTLGHMIVDFPVGAFMIALPFIKHKFGLNYEQIALAPMIFNLTSSVAQPLFGYLSDRRPRGYLIPVGCLLTSSGLSMCMLSPSYPWFLAATVLSGLGGAAFHPEATRGANLYSGKSKGRGIGTFVVGGFVGVAAGSLAMGMLLNQTWPWQGVFTLPAIVLFLPLWRAARRVPQISIKKTGRLVSRGMKMALAMILMVLFIRSFITSGISTFVPMFLVNARNTSEEFSGGVYSLMMVGSMLGTYFGGLLNDRFGYRRVLLWSLLPIIPTVYLFTWLPVKLAAISISLNSVFISASWTSLMLLAQKAMPEYLATASALTMGFAMGMGAIAVVLLGKLADIYGLNRVFDLIMLLPVAAFAVSWLITDRQPQERRSAGPPEHSRKPGCGQ
ncbi:MAG: MFS transporter [Negativicutes bacterium]|nr:MFS transporter [Negativicutes bacterium]